MRGTMPEFIASMYAVDPDDGRPWLHVLLRSPERLPAEEKLELIERVQTTSAKAFPGAEATGYYVLLADLIESVLDDQWKTFAVASLAVLAMTLVAFRNVPLAVATMIPNALPVLVLFGAMGWLGIKTNMGAAMIAAVSVGLSIDSSIHYVHALPAPPPAGDDDGRGAGPRPGLRRPRGDAVDARADRGLRHAVRERLHPDDLLRRPGEPVDDRRAGGQHPGAADADPEAGPADVCVGTLGN